MDHLITLAEDFGLREIVGRAMEHSSVQGVVVDIDPIWLTFWEWHVTGGSRHEDWLYRRGWRYGEVPRVPALVRGPTQSDMWWRPPFWSDINRDRNVPEDAPPLMVKVCFEPTAELPKEPNFGSERLQVVTEFRPLARLASGPKDVIRPLVGGLSVGTGSSSPGTLGGILRDKTGKSFALTCSHVLPPKAPADQPASQDNSAATFIGSVAAASVLNVSPGGHCNPYNAGGLMNQVDAALIELDPNIASESEVLQIGPIYGVTRKAMMSPELIVEMSGRTSGHRDLVVGGIAATYRFRDSADNLYCFEHLFELRWPSFLRLVLSRPVSGGDSGAWVCAQGQKGTEWCGMVIGEDRLQGYAALSENIMNWLQGEGYDLDCK